jgi:DNA-binding transcriptional LysR family regulator
VDRFKTIGTFVQIAKSQSLSKAADELGISRALASSHLKQLEHHLGVRLINRTTRRLALTEAGTQYLAFCTDALSSFEAQEARITQLQTAPEGHLKLMVSMAFGQHLAPAITDFTAQYDRVRISLILSDRSFSPSDFLESGYDLGVSMHPIKDASIVSTKVGDVTWIACATQTYLDTHPAVRSPADLVAHNCLAHRSHAADSIWRFNGPGGRSDIPVTGALFSNSSLVLRAAVRAHAGIAMLPLYSVGRDLDAGRLTRILSDYTGPKRPVYLVYPHIRYVPKRTRLFIDFLRKRLKNARL